MQSIWKRWTGAGALALVLAVGVGTMQGSGLYAAPQGYGQGGGYGPGGPGGWDTPPQEMRDAARQGFQDGIRGAQKDVENHRRPNVNNRDEFRHPNIPGNVRRDYKDGFRRGYSAAMQHMANGGGDRRDRY